MVFTVDFLGDGRPLVWSLTGTVDDPGWTATRDATYRPSLFVATAEGMQTATPDESACASTLETLGDDLAIHPAVASTAIERRQPGFRFADQAVLRVDVTRMGEVRNLASTIERRGPPGRVPYRAFDVDFSPGFRYCLDRERSPRPARPPTVLSLALSRRAAADGDLAALEIGDRAVTPTESDAEFTTATRPAGDTTTAVLRTLRNRLAHEDPDILAVERGAIVPLVADSARAHDVDVGLARVPARMAPSAVPTHQELAGASTFESYGQVRHSPARYNVPGRVLIDRSNTFFLKETNLAGCLDLVERSRKPLQELAWASIGNVLTAIQIRAARARGVLVQWRAWRPERFKTAATLHDADRGGTTLSPVVSLHEGVHELDFASLYPNIIREFNLSPETVRCGCHDRADVPELGYAVCDEEGYLLDVLGPLIDDRAAIKQRLAATEAANEDWDSGLSAAEQDALEGQSSALKWILVSCFGYQGFSNAKFGRIEVHEAINAYARDILLTAKEKLEAGGWRVVHGIVDSVWVTPREEVAEPTPLPDIAEMLTETVGIPLEYEGAFEWVAFCPRRDGEAGALTRYFGRHQQPEEPTNGAETTTYKYRGIECRQRSTCAWIGALQRELIRVLDARRDPDAVCDRLAVRLRDLRRGEVDPTALVITTWVSKDADAYAHRTRTVAALERAGELGRSVSPGEDVRYVVADNDRDSIDRVRLAGEIDATTEYDRSFYRTRAIRATGSILSPLRWDEERIRARLADHRSVSIEDFTD